MRRLLRIDGLRCESSRCMQTPTKRVCGAASECALLGKLAYKAPYVRSLLKGNPDVGGFVRRLGA